MVLRKATSLAAVGIVLGLGLTFVASRALAGLLFDISPTDAPTYAAVVALLAFVALLAAAIPAVRASRIDGVQALRL